MTGFEILEHTADVGIRAWGDSPEALFEQAARGLADILGAWSPGDGESYDVVLESRDLEGLLVDWLNEVIYLQESRDAVLAGINVDQIQKDHLVGRVTLARRTTVLDGTAVKAVTYHQLKAARKDDGKWIAEVYVDV